MTKTRNVKTILLSLLFVFMMLFGVASLGTLQASANETAGGTYAVTVDGNIENGTVTADSTSVAAGETVTLTVIPADGYELESLTVTDGTGATVEAIDNTFVMPASEVTVTAVFKEIKLYIKVFDWYDRELTYVEATELTDPDGDGTYESSPSFTGNRKPRTDDRLVR